MPCLRPWNTFEALRGLALLAVTQTASSAGSKLPHSTSPKGKQPGDFLFVRSYRPVQDRLHQEPCLGQIEAEHGKSARILSLRTTGSGPVTWCDIRCLLRIKRSCWWVHNVLFLRASEIAGELVPLIQFQILTFPENYFFSAHKTILSDHVWL